MTHILYIIAIAVFATVQVACPPPISAPPDPLAPEQQRFHQFFAWKHLKWSFLPASFPSSPAAKPSRADLNTLKRTVAHNVDAFHRALKRTAIPPASYPVTIWNLFSSFVVWQGRSVIDIYSKYRYTTFAYGRSLVVDKTGELVKGVLRNYLGYYEADVDELLEGDDFGRLLMLHVDLNELVYRFMDRVIPAYADDDFFEPSSSS